VQPLTPSEATAARDRRQTIDRRQRRRERRQLELARSLATHDERRAANDDRRSGLDRRFAWTTPPRRSFPVKQRLAAMPEPARLGTRVDLYI
jgi:hypothetical protein